MKSLAYGTTLLLTPKNEIILQRDKKDVLVKQGEFDLGFCSPCIDGKGKQEGWHAFAYTAPCETLTAEFEKLSEAFVFVTEHGVAL